jgi:hypothetical protein
MKSSITPVLPRLRVGLLLRWPAAIVASASNPIRKGGSVRTRPSIALHALRDRHVRLCERHCARRLMQWSITPLLPRLRVGLLVDWPAAIGASASNPIRKGGSVRTRPSIALHALCDKRLRLCERYCEG